MSGELGVTKFVVRSGLHRERTAIGQHARM